MRIGIVTCRPLPEPDPDESLLLQALSDAGHHASTLAWNRAESPEGFDMCVVRSTWDYFLNPEAFQRWIEQSERATTLLNPASVLQWNMHKGYLRELEVAGIPIVPTAWRRRGESADISKLMQDRTWEDVVVKPCVSAGSWRTKRFARNETERASAFLEELTSERDAMIQRFLPSVQDPLTPERSILWIDGELTHVIHKRVRFHADAEQVSEALEPTREERDFAMQTLEAMPFDLADLLYARVDVMTGDNGKTLLSELELLEPSLFLLQSPSALDRLVAGISKRGPR